MPSQWQFRRQEEQQQQFGLVLTTFIILLSILALLARTTYLLEHTYVQRKKQTRPVRKSKNKAPETGIKNQRRGFRTFRTVLGKFVI